MIRDIKIYGNPVLRQTSNNIPKYFKDLKSLITDMFDISNKFNGIGLAAIQLGLPFNIFIVNIENNELNINFKETFINPVIQDYYGNIVNMNEGCLSIPKLNALVKRKDKIKIKYINQNWEEQESEFNGIISRVIQHEYDHLNGKLYIDHITGMWKQIMFQPLNTIKKYGEQQI